MVPFLSIAMFLSVFYFQSIFDFICSSRMTKKEYKPLKLSVVDRVNYVDGATSVLQRT